VNGHLRKPHVYPGFREGDVFPLIDFVWDM
jgi:hypothetical protein